MRIQVAKRATAIAEYFGIREKCSIDCRFPIKSCTCSERAWLGSGRTANLERLSSARNITTSKSYRENWDPSSTNSGTITAIYTILADGDDTTSDPVVDTARAILDGHIVLSREMAQQSIYPAIDVNQSVQ